VGKRFHNRNRLDQRARARSRAPEERAPASDEQDAGVQQLSIEEERSSRPTMPLSLDQLNIQEEPVLIPIAANSSINDMIRQILAAQAPQVELLVPNGTMALQSPAGCQTLQKAANGAGINLTLYVADQQIAKAAQRSGIEVMPVGESITAPIRVSRQPSITRRLSLPDQDDHVPQLNWRRTDGGAALVDTPSDASIRRPGFNDSEWEAARQALDQTAEADIPLDDLMDQVPPVSWQQSEAPPWRQGEAKQEELPRPSLLGALIGVLPRRSARMAPEPNQVAPFGRAVAWDEDEAERGRSSRWLPLLPLLLIALLLLAAGLLWYSLGGALPNLGLGSPAPVVVNPPLIDTGTLTYTDLVVPLTTERVGNSPSISVRGLQLTEPVTVSLTGQVSGTTETPLGYARGSLTLVNRSTQPVTIPAGTTITAAGQEFIFEDDAFVPGLVERADGTGVDYGITTAQLRAVTPGTQGNIPAGTITSLPESLIAGAQLAVYQNEQFTGGTNVEAQTVSIDDVNELWPEALERLYSQGVQSLQNQVAQYPGFAIPEGAITPTLEMVRDLPRENYTVFPPIGQVTEDGNFTLEVFYTFEALAEPVDDPIREQLRQAVATQVRQAENLEVESVQIEDWRREGQTLVVDATVQTQPRRGEVPEALQERIKRTIADLPRAEAETFLQQLVEDGEISDFQLPPEWQTVPSDVQIVVRNSQPESGS
jgi:hypothetical protein